MQRLKRIMEVIVVNSSTNIALYTEIKCSWLCPSLLNILGQLNAVVFNLYNVFARCLLYQNKSLLPSID